jgi:hypothetical protein
VFGASVDTVGELPWLEKSVYTPVPVGVAHVAPGGARLLLERVLSG